MIYVPTTVFYVGCDVLLALAYIYGIAGIFIQNVLKNWEKIHTY